MVPEAIWVLVVSMDISCNRSSTQLQNSELKIIKISFTTSAGWFVSFFSFVLSKHGISSIYTLAFDFCLFYELAATSQATVCGNFSHDKKNNI